MKRFILSILLVGIFTVSLVAEMQKVAVLNFEKSDRASEYVKNQLMKGDFKKALKDNENFELLDIKATSKAFKNSGYQYLGKNEAAKLASELGADFVLWGSVSSISNTEFKLQVNAYNKQAQELFATTFTAEKNTKKRVTAIQENLIMKMEEFGAGAITKFMDIGMQHLNSKNYASAEDSFMELLKIDPKQVDAYLYIGLIKFLNKDYPASIDFYLQGLEKAPENINLLDYLSKAYMKMEKFEEAVEALSKIVEIEEENIDIWFRIGTIYSEMEFYDEAQEAFEKIIDLDSEYSDAYLALGIMLYDQELYDDAIEPLEYASDAFPDLEHVQKKLAKSYMKAGKLDSAIAKYQEVIAEQPDNVNAYFNLAAAYRVTEQNQKALNTLLELKKLAPEMPKAYFRLADTHLALKDYRKAKEAANQAIGLDETKYEPYKTLATVNQRLGYSKYEKYLDYEEKYKDKSVYYGDKADQLVEARDRVKSEAYAYFVKSGDYLSEAEKRTEDRSNLKEIKASRETLKQLKNATKAGGF